MYILLLRGQMAIQNLIEKNNNKEGKSSITRLTFWRPRTDYSKLF